MKSLIFAAFVLAIVRSAAATAGCSFDPIAACDSCDFSLSFHQYRVNPCNCTEYYNCYKNRGEITATKQACRSCLCFDDKTMGCTIWVGGDDCSDPKITEEVISIDTISCRRNGNGPAGDYSQEYRRVTDRPQLNPNQDLYFYWHVFDTDILSRCPPGTYFDLTTCQCIACYDGQPSNCLISDSKVFCLDFDNDGAERGIWYAQDSSCSLVPDTLENNALLLPGVPCALEIPYFQNNEFTAFTFCGWFNADAINLGTSQGLAFNGGPPGGDCYPGSIQITLESDRLVHGGIITSDAPNNFFLVNPTQILSGIWYRVCLKYDGASLELNVHQKGAPSSWDSSVSTKATGVTQRDKCNLQLGAAFDASGTRNFFEGRLDEWCFWNTAVTYPTIPY